MNPLYILMDNRSWNILCWNVRGLNDKDKWDPIRNKIDESEANLFCIKETKKASFDLHFIRKLTNLISAHLRVPRGVFLFAGLQNSSRLPLWKSITLPSSFLLLLALKPGPLLLFMVLVGNQIEIFLLTGYTTLILMMMIFGSSLEISIFIEVLITEISQGVISMILLSLIVLLATLVSLSCLLRGEATHGVTCKTPLYLNRLIGFSLQWLGLPSSHQLWFFLLPKSPLTMCPAKSKLVLPSPKSIFSDLKISGSIILAAWSKLPMHGPLLLDQ